MWILPLLSAFVAIPEASAYYYGVKLATFSPKALHEIKGDVYVADERSFYFVNFYYDGKAPKAYFMVGKGEPDFKGIILPNERGKKDVLKRYENATFVISLEGNSTVKNFDYVTVFCWMFGADFGFLQIPANFTLPTEISLGPLSGAQSVKADDIVLKDAKTMFLKNFHYDGVAHDAHFIVGTTDTPERTSAIHIPDEHCVDKLGVYQGKDVTLRLPKGSWSDYKWFSVYDFTGNSSLASVSLKPEDTLRIPAHLSKMTPGSAAPSLPSSLSLYALALFVLGTTQATVLKFR